MTVKVDTMFAHVTHPTGMRSTGCKNCARRNVYICMHTYVTMVVMHEASYKFHCEVRTFTVQSEFRHRLQLAANPLGKLRITINRHEIYAVSPVHAYAAVHIGIQLLRISLWHKLFPGGMYS